MDDLTSRREAPTISQVAEAAGVSRATVSRAFTRPDMLSADTVRRVITDGRGPQRPPVSHFEDPSFISPLAR